MNIHEPADNAIKQFLYNVYGWMSVGLTVTATVAYYVAEHTSWYQELTKHPWWVVALIVAQLGLVAGLSFFIHRLSRPAAIVLFVGYAALTGLMLSSIFFVYSLGSITQTFLITAGMFGGMSIYGYVTKTDLSGWGNILTMALWGIIIATLINLYFQNTAMQMGISFFGVIIFTLLTAYDTQKIKNLAYQQRGNGEPMEQMSILGALVLYLDFLNLFLYLLQFFGKGKEQQ